MHHNDVAAHHDAAAHHNDVAAHHDMVAHHNGVVVQHNDVAVHHDMAAHLTRWDGKLVKCAAYPL